MPSIPTCNSMYSTPVAAHASASASLMARDAPEMSVSPLQNNSKPSPVPGPSTLTATPGATSSNNSATRTETGSTVEEPETSTVPSRLPSSSTDSGADTAVVVAGAAVVAVAVSEEDDEPSSLLPQPKTKAVHASKAKRLINLRFIKFPFLDFKIDGLSAKSSQHNIKKAAKQKPIIWRT